MTKKLFISINGFGRIGRAFFRAAEGREDMEIVAINDLGDLNNLAYLLKYDSVYGRYDKSIKVEGKNLIINEKKIPVISERNPLYIDF